MVYISLKYLHLPSIAMPTCMKFIFPKSIHIRKNVKRNGAYMLQRNKFLQFFLTSAEENSKNFVQISWILLWSIVMEHKLEKFSEKNLRNFVLLDKRPGFQKTTSFCLEVLISRIFYCKKV